MNAPRLNHALRRRLFLEALECRATPAVYTVSALTDTGAGSGTSGDLRFCINKANTAVGADTINFAITGTITLTGTALTLSDTTGNTTLNGPGANLITINANAKSQVFRINSGVTAAINGVTLTSGRMTSAGGGILNLGNLAISGATIKSNLASGASGQGGGVANSGTGTLVITNSTFTGNGATGGGAVANTSTGTITINNCTFSGNAANSSTSGGAVYNPAGGTLNVNNSTINRNTASSGGGIFNAGILNVTNTIVAGNTAGTGADISGSLNTNISNLLNLSTAAAGLGTLGNYGGPTQTIPLLAGSPAIDAGSSTTLTFDQRSAPFLRASGPVDIGAYEVQSLNCVVDNFAADLDDGNYQVGNLTLREAVNLSNVNTGPDSIAFSLSGPATITLGGTVLTLSDATGKTTLNGPGASSVTISGNSKSQVFQIKAGVSAEINGVTITKGASHNGSGIFNSGTLTVSNSVIANNAAAGAVGVGAGIANAGTSTLTISNCTFTSNVSGGAGGTGGAIANSTTGTVVVTNSTFTNNNAGGAGGRGGGIANSAAGNVIVTNCTFSGNIAGGAGGTGGAIANSSTGSVVVANSKFTSNLGGGAGGTGGAIANSNTGTVVVTNSTFTTNVAGGAGGRGGALANTGAGSFSIANSSIVACTAGGAGGRGGGISNSSSGQFTITNVTISGCFSQGAGGSGGGIASTGTGTVTLVNSTISGNSAGVGSGVYNTSVLKAINTIVAGNKGSTFEVPGSLAVNVNNLMNLSATAAGLAPLGNYGGATQTYRLLPGSPAIDTGSDSVLSSPFNLTNDQRGAPFNRLSGTHVDIGAYEVQSLNLVVDNNAADLDDGNYTTGNLTLREAVNQANLNFGPDSITFSLGPVATITLGSSVLTAADTTGKLAITNAGTNRIMIDANLKSRALQINSGVTVEITGIAIAQGFANGSGGAINNAGVLTINNSTLLNSNATAGGAIANTGTLTIINCTFSGNTATGNGGGILNAAGKTTVVNSTFSGNSAANGGGISIGSGTVALTNSIVAGNASAVGTDVDGSLATNDHNLINVSKAAAGLGALGNYGGPTQTIPLLPGSVAINAGNSIVISDQRGQPRFGAPDIGAFESQGFQFSTSGSGQTANINTQFLNPLVVTVVANNNTEPVDGGVIQFASPNAGPSATLSDSSATIVGGSASVTATANGFAGEYDVKATCGSYSTNFALTNAGPPDVVSLVQVGGTLFATFGDHGNKIDVFGQAGAITIRSNYTVLGVFNINGNLTVTGGDGNDTFSVTANSNSSMPSLVKIVGDLGDDLVTVGSSGNTPGTFQNLTLNLGDGNNRVVDQGVIVSNNLTIDAGDGNDTVGTWTSSVGNRLRVTLGDGNNLASLLGLVGQQIYYSGGNGLDSLTVGGVNGSCVLFAYLGASNDTFSFAPGSSINGGIIDFGQGADTYVPNGVFVGGSLMIQNL